MKTKEEIALLQEQWVADPCWDIEDTYGFEMHSDELLIFRLKHDNAVLSAQLNEQTKILKAFKKLLAECG